MPRMGGPSRGCRMCRERKIKCDELIPQCLQCTSSGRQCPGPITGAFVSDMTPKFIQALPDSRSRGTRNESEIQSAAFHSVEDRADIEVVALGEPTNDSGNQLASIPKLGKAARIAPSNAAKFVARPEIIGAAIDPFHNLPIELRSKPARSFFDYCANVMSYSLIPFGGMDPMRDVWLPWVLSDQLLFASMLFRASVPISLLASSPDIESMIWRGATLSLLNRRLASPTQAVNDITVASVISLTQQSIIRGDTEETKLHMAGLEKMLSSKTSYSPMPPVQEVLFWTDLFGSASTHQPMRNYTAKPDNILLPCLPIHLHPGTTIFNLCVAFQPFLLTPIFGPLVGPLHELRCLTITFHFSGCTANLEIPLFSQLCRSNKTKCQTLLKNAGSDTFDLCLLAIMLFIDTVLLSDNTDTLLLSTMLQTTFKSMKLEEVTAMDKKLMLWLLYIGCATTRDTNLASWYRGHFASALSILDILSSKAVKRILVEFLWIDGICDIYLAEILKSCDIGSLDPALDGV